MRSAAAFAPTTRKLPSLLVRLLDGIRRQPSTPRLDVSRLSDHLRRDLGLR